MCSANRDALSCSASGRDAAAAIQEIDAHLKSLGGRYLLPGHNLKIEVFDIDLAGRRPFSVRFNPDMRILEGKADWPSIKLQYVLESAGNVLDNRHENIADLGGVMMGYEAFKKTNQYKNNEKIGSLTPDQRFFLGYANAWMINSRPEALADQVRSNEHSPAKQRVIGPLVNMPEFFTTFGIKEGDAMWRADSLRVKIW